MAYTTEELEKEALAVIKEKELVFIDEVCAFMTCSKATFYNHKVEQLDAIKAAIGKNKLSIKHQIRRDWKDGNPTEKISLYKILGNEDERDALNGSSKTQDHGKLEIEIIDKTIKKVEDD